MTTTTAFFYWTGIVIVTAIGLAGVAAALAFMFVLVAQLWLGAWEKYASYHGVRWSWRCFQRHRRALLSFAKAYLRDPEGTYTGGNSVDRDAMQQVVDEYERGNL